MIVSLFRPIVHLYKCPLKEKNIDRKYSANNSTVSKQVTCSFRKPYKFRVFFLISDSRASMLRRWLFQSIFDHQASPVFISNHLGLSQIISASILVVSQWLSQPSQYWNSWWIISTSISINKFSSRIFLFLFL